MKIFTLSDLHPGRWLRGERETEKALYLHAEQAIEEGVQRVVLNGDYSEELLLRRKEIDPVIYRRQCATVGRVLALLQRNSDAPIEIVPGNHDDLLMLEGDRLNELFNQPGLCFKKSPSVHILDSIGHTHAHLLVGQRSVRACIEQALRGEGRNMLASVINHSPEALLNEVWEPSGGWEIVSHFQRMLKKLPGYEQLTEAYAIPALREALKRREQERHEQMSEDELLVTGGKKSMTALAADLAVALDVPVMVIGHNHLPGIAPRRVFDPLYNRWKTVWVVNSGGYIGKGGFKGASLIDTERQSIDLRRFDPGKDCVITDQSARYFTAA